MSKSISKSTINKGGRPRTYRTPILVRLDKADLSALDGELREFRPKLTRPEAIRRVLRAHLNVGRMTDFLKRKLEQL